MALLFDSLFSSKKEEKVTYNTEYQIANTTQNSYAISTFNVASGATVSGIALEQNVKPSSAVAQAGQRPETTQKSDDSQTDGSTLWLIAAAAVAAIILLKK